MDFEAARYNMIEQQIRTWEVFDQNVLDAVQGLPREDFMPSQYRDLALADTRIPLGHGQQTMTPKTEARMLQALDLRADDRVLEIGTGSAYVTALLGRLCREVISLDVFADFTGAAREKLKQHDIGNVELLTSDGLNGYAPAAPYDVIVVTGSIPQMQNQYKQQLANDGRLFVVIGRSPVMEATLFTRRSKDTCTRDVLYETDLPALVGAEQPPAFEI